MEDSISVENSPHEILTDGYAASGDKYFFREELRK